MPRANTNKEYRTFVRGLVTEAGFLTFPEDASYDESNTVISRKGNRTRRLGQTYVNDSVNVAIQALPGEARNEFVWKAVGQKPNTNFLCMQSGKFVNFFDLNSVPIATSNKFFSIDLSLYLRPGASLDSLKTTDALFAAGKGFLFIVNENIEPLSVEYDSVNDAINVKTITILIRDFEGLDDNLQNDEEPLVLSKEHHYNLQNQGWTTSKSSTPQFTPTTMGDGGIVYVFESYIEARNNFTDRPIAAYQQAPAQNPIFIFQSKLGKYPGNNKQWWVARAQADDDDKGIKVGDFLPEVLDKSYAGNNRSPRGHYILNAFRKDRTLVSGVSDLAIEEEEQRPNAITFFAGRAWYGCGSTVYYSQLLDTNSPRKAGLCYQEADPTSEDISELIPTDGGVVPIPEIDRIEKLLPLANGVVVFALNGVWFISGGDAAFSATNISVDKISPIGTISPNSIIETDGVIFWWSEIGIQALQQASGQFGPIPGKFGNSNVSEQTVQSFYNGITQGNKREAKAVYDTRNNVLMWLFRSGETVDKNRYDSCLLYDMTLQAFYPWKFSMIEDGPQLTGIFLKPGFSEELEFNTVTDDNVSVTDGGLPITSGQFTTSVRPSNVVYIVQLPNGTTFSQTENSTFADWVDFDGEGLGYDSFVETGFEIHADAARRKQITYLLSHFANTDTVDDSNPSSCYLTTKWDWASRAFSNKWSTKVQVYRKRASIGKDFYVVTSKDKVRGSGKSIQFRFGTDEIGRNFDLLGWSVAYSGNTQP